MANTWKDDLPGCFGTADHIFAGHPNDTDRARKLLTRVFAENISPADLRAAVTEYLKSKGCTKDHISRQIRNVFDVERYFD